MGELAPPQPPSRALLLALLGNHWQGRDPCPEGGSTVAAGTGTFIEVLGRAGIGEAAVRATLARAVTKGLLERHRRGRHAYFSPTTETRRLLAEGAQRLHHDAPVRDDWDGTWTLLAYSLPETRRDDRHQLRRRLSWEGFGPLRDGMWVAPGRVDVGHMATDLGVTDDVHAFEATAVVPTCPHRMVAEAWDLDSIATGYRQFRGRWDTAIPLPGLADDLARSLWLVTEWRQLVLEDPMLPADLLPNDWPAVLAREVFDDCYARFERTAPPLFENALDALAPASTH